MKKTNMKSIIVGVILVVFVILAGTFCYKVDAETKKNDAEIDMLIGSVVADNLRVKLVKEYGDDYSFITRYLGNDDYEVTAVDMYDCFIMKFHVDDTSEFVNLDSDDLSQWLEDNLVDMIMVYDDVQYTYDEAIAYGLIY